MMKFRLLHLAACLAFIFKFSICVGQSDLVFAKGYDFGFEESLELYDHSIKERKELAKTDPSKHYFFIGENYRTGINADKDLKKAKRFFEKSAESDKRGTKWTALAYYHLALLKLYDSESPKGKDIEMLSLLQKAADQECPQAAFNLGLANYLGNDNLGITKNWSQAERFLSKSRGKRAYQKLSEMHSEPGISYGLVARAKKFKEYSRLADEMDFFRNKMERYRNYFNFEKLHTAVPDFFDVKRPPSLKGEIIGDTDKKISYIREAELNRFFDTPVESSMVDQCLQAMQDELFGSDYEVKGWEEYITRKDLLKEVCNGKDALIWSSIEQALVVYFEAYAQSLVHSDSVIGIFRTLHEFKSMNSGMYGQEIKLLTSGLIACIHLSDEQYTLRSIRQATFETYPIIAKELSDRIRTIEWNEVVKSDEPLMYKIFIMNNGEGKYVNLAEEYLSYEENYLTFSSLKRLFLKHRDQPDAEIASRYILYRLKDIMHTNTRFNNPSRANFIKNYVHIIDQNISTQTSYESGLLMKTSTWENVYKGEVVLGVNSSHKDVVQTIDYPSTLLEWYFSDDYTFRSNWQEMESSMPMDEISLVVKIGQFRFQRPRQFPASLNPGSYNIVSVPYDYRFSESSSLTMFGNVLVTGVGFGIAIGSTMAVLTPAPSLGTDAECYERQGKRKSAFSKPRYVNYDVKCYDGRMEMVELDTKTGKYAKMIRYKSFFQLDTFDEAARLKCNCDD